MLTNKCINIDPGMTQKAFEKVQEIKKLQKANNSSGVKNNQSASQISKKVSNVFG